MANANGMPHKYNDRLLAWGSNIEPGTINQAFKATTLPFVPGPVALMPDAHIGIGATVGSVIPTEGAIVPSFAGVDLGCVDKDSEYLSPFGWRKISEYESDPYGFVMQYNPAEGTASFVMPQRYIIKDCPEFFEFRTKYGINQRLSPDHRVLFWKKEGRDSRYVETVMTAEQFAADHDRLKLGVNGLFQTTFTPVLKTVLPYADSEIRVQVMVNADATLEPNGTAIVHVKKQRKIERARKLLADAGIDYTERPQGDGTVNFRFKAPLDSKSYGYFWLSSREQLEVINDEVLNWDGNEKDQVFFTRVRESADFIQYVFTATGSRAVMREDKDEDGSTDYRVFRHDKPMTGMRGSPKGRITKVPSEDGKAYCFTVPSGFWVMRRDGNVVMTGNCGMIATETGYTEDDLPDNLDKLFPLVAKGIPAGVGQGHTSENREFWKQALKIPSHFTPDEEKRALQQFGSLGSGNHFAEVSVDRRGVVWTVLHSGSRGIGNLLARKHMDIAKGDMKKRFIRLDDPDLAYFVEGTPEFKAYIDDMLWAQDYAKGNRLAMNASLLSSLESVVGKPLVQVRVVNCHHNYTARERHLGRELWITRKGAIRAESGDMGVIPGSMGTDSYIVRGKGNPASYNSSAHGAGRTMSRAEAKRTLDRDGLRAQMAGKTWNGDAEALIDEDPRAYKDIARVMADQADLTEVVHVLSQRFNYKGTR